MPRVAWLTDIHLNFVPGRDLPVVFDRIRRASPDALLITGDFGESDSVCRYLAELSDELDVPVYFVLGNHDFYGGSIATVRHEVTELCRERQNLQYLTSVQEPLDLAPGIGVIGHDGWADARLGDYERSLVMMNDYLLIAELARLGKRDRLPVLHARGDEAAAHLRHVLPLALARYPRVMLLTHIPPLREACWHQGRISDDEWAPHFTCKAVGDAILDVMRDFPQRQLTVLCGHTHSRGECHPLPNVEILTGAADYGEPMIEKVFEL